MEDKEEVTNDPQRTGNKETSQGLERKMPKYNKKKKKKTAEMFQSLLRIFRRDLK